MNVCNACLCYIICDTQGYSVSVNVIVDVNHVTDIHTTQLELKVLARESLSCKLEVYMQMRVWHACVALVLCGALSVSQPSKQYNDIVCI